MKYLKYTLLVLLIAFVAYFSYAILFPSSPLDKVVYKSENDKEVTITYSKPFKKDRLIFGNESDGALVPYNQYWRTGANRHTIINTNSDLNFSDNILLAGEYSLYTIPGESTWKVVINSDNGFFGVGEADPDKDVLRVSIGSIKNTETVEQFTIDFSDSLNTYMNLKWDKTLISIPLK